MNSDLVPVRRALISVSDKTGLIELAATLHREFAIEIVSTGGTARALAAAGLPVKDVAQITGFPEMMDGRVKTLHPSVHGGLLALRDNAEHRAAMHLHHIDPIDLLIVNLYPFEQVTSRPECTLEQAVENIDIGGPAMIRSAAKNHRSVVVVTDASQYELLIHELRRHQGATPLVFRNTLAVDAFARTARYDAAINIYLRQHQTPEDTVILPPVLAPVLRLKQILRYGENPHQAGALYTATAENRGLAGAEQLHGKALSYLNILDADAALALVNEFSQPAAAIIKHANPCGCATAPTLTEAFALAYAGDPVAAFGGIVAFNAPVDKMTAENIVAGKRFIEVLLAPGFDTTALTLLQQRWADCRILRVARPAMDALTFRTIGGGVLAQQSDSIGFDESQANVVSKRRPDGAQWRDLAFAMLVCKHVKSNAITLVRNGQLLGAGAGQMSRVTSCRLAVDLARGNAHGEKLAGAAAASDAFFPFPDGPEILIAAGATAIIQPGGSKKDDLTIQLCDQHDVALVFTGIRHFRH
ncbi:MAG: bifunctional phosphoribosylaminoimidazolecarboxamide formyltransferase/IMP cyclohydrolase [Phycisphaerae bacterium]